ncbi:hypothetical protein [Tepidibacter sp. Z1-5]|uniref:hypothetical protein n=1 Tax=Tepidibacter sp. Z1-5 TaxID=3134138 RepID=UPI0030BE873C
MYLVEFILRNDTKNYGKTNLNHYNIIIEEGIKIFNNHVSRSYDKSTLQLVDIHEKSFIISVDSNSILNPNTRSFSTRIGSLSRYLRALGMEELLSPHNKLFNLNIIEKNKKEKPNKKNIYIDYSSQSIMIPKELTENLSIHFY